jgi:hypothetical protein
MQRTAGLEQFQEQLRQWKLLEQSARDAEQKLGNGQLGASPEAARLARDATEKRRAADEFLAVLLGGRRAADRKQP